MKRIICVILSCVLLSGCGYQYERNRDRNEAKTLQQKRDVLIKWSPHEINRKSLDEPGSIYEARRKYIGGGEESESFLEGLISSCYGSKSDMCAYAYYLQAANLEDKKIKEEQKKISDEYSKYLREDRAKKTPVSKGDLFYCKVAINPGAEFIDSGVRAGVKDNINSYGVVFSNGYRIISPDLNIIEPNSGFRAGRTSDGLNMFIAAYDSAQYKIDSSKKMKLVQLLGGRYISETEYNEPSTSIVMFDCKKSN